MNPIAYRSSILHFLTDVDHQYYEDGVLVVEDGKIAWIGDSRDLAQFKKQPQIVRYHDSLIVPGFVDTHIHFPQTNMIASYGEQLLEWLHTYTFPEEEKFSDFAYASQTADIFFRELLKNGTTTALVMGTAHPESAQALFEKAETLKIRLIAGQVLADQNLPDSLKVSPQKTKSDSISLINQWHGRSRLQYALTPRFAPTSSREHLAALHELATQFPDVYIHTHVSENQTEVEWVKELHPWSHDYLDVYEQYGLVKPRAVFAHGIYLSDDEHKRLRAKDASLSFCPTANSFLGSGLFNLQKTKAAKIRLGLGTDVGGGTSFSLLQTMREAYTISQLQGQKISAFDGFYLATLGGAKALHLDDKIGNFEVGKEADFVVLNLHATELLEWRMRFAKTLHDKLFLLMILGDDRVIRETFIAGQPIAIYGDIK